MSAPSGTGGHLRRLEQGQFEYTCLFHPHQIGRSLSDRCPDCGRAYGFFLSPDAAPTQIGRQFVVAAIGRGFFSAVFKVQHATIPNRFSAIKIIPVHTYAPKLAGGYGKDPKVELELLQELVTAGVAPALLDAGEVEVTFPDAEPLLCHFVELEFLNGDLLETLIQQGTSDPREVTQIALDLVEIVAQLKQRGLEHNDLHGENLLVTRLSQADARYAAVHPQIEVKVLDLGAAGRSPRSDSRLSDLQWVARHLHGLLDRCEASDPELPPEQRKLCAQLRRVAEYFIGARDEQHPVNPRDVQQQIRDAYAAGRRLVGQPVSLPTVAAHSNARSMPAWFTPELLHDPDGKWGRTVTSPGMHLVYGMRGCGKTMLLRSLEWPARIRPRADREETLSDVRTRVTEEHFLGVFVSCSSLLRGVHPDLAEAPLHRAFLAFARELLLHAELTDLGGVGSIDHGALAPLAELIAREVSWFVPPLGLLDVAVLEAAVVAALRAPVPREELPHFSPEAVFDELALTARELIDVWRDKYVLFMLDDVSIRFLERDGVKSLIQSLCLQTQNYGFKISTESHSLELVNAWGVLAQAGRDFTPFDLGEEVYAELGGQGGVRFIESLLNRRLAVLERHSASTARELLGSHSLEDLANDLKSKSRYPYWGVEVLAGLCVGDISDILWLYERIEARGDGLPRPLKPEVQHKAIVDLATSKVRGLLAAGESAHSHALAFARASRRELLRHGRNRQFGLVHIYLDQEAAARIYPEVLSLVEKGVFVLTGGNARTKSSATDTQLQIKLAYRRLLGVPTGMPLGRRDRFELKSVDEIQSWLREPHADKLSWGHLSGPDSAEAPLYVPDDDDGESDAAPHQKTSMQMALSAPERAANASLPVPRSATTVVTVYSGDIRGADLDWHSATVVTACGFEERAAVSWRRLADCEPRGWLALRYPLPGRTAEFEEFAKGAPVNFIELHDSTDCALVVDSLQTITGPVLVDSTALTKPVLFEAVRWLLVTHGEVWVSYTEAEKYFPDEELLQDLDAALRGQDASAFARLDDEVTGSYGPFRTVAVGVEASDPGKPNVLAMPIPLKHSRAEQILLDLAVEQLLAVVPEAAPDRWSARTRAGQALADYYVRQYGGESALIPAIDHERMYAFLQARHAEWALSYGCNFIMALTGSKMHTVAAAMLASTTTVAATVYSEPTGGHDVHHYTTGAGPTHIVHLVRQQILIS